MMLRSKSRSKAAVFLLGVLTAVVLGGCITPQPPAATTRQPTPADREFERLGNRYLNEMLALTPVNATLLGDHRFDAELDDVGPTARNHRAELARSLLAELATIDATQLSRPNQVDARLLQRSLEYTLWQLTELEDWR
jgi:uncharacterized protein (DUF885 family)